MRMGKGKGKALQDRKGLSGDLIVSLEAMTVSCLGYESSGR